MYTVIHDFVFHITLNYFLGGLLILSNLYKLDPD